MSIWAVNWALHAEVSNPTHKLVLIALANFADDQDEAWPKVESLALLASSSKRTVHRALADLEGLGLLTRVTGMAAGARGGFRQTNTLYRLAVPDDVSRRGTERASRPLRLAFPQGSVPQSLRRSTGPEEAPRDNRCDMDDSPKRPVTESPNENRCAIGVTAGDRGDTGVADRSAMGGAAYKEEPSEEYTNQTPRTPRDRDRQDRSGRSGDTSKDDWALIRSALPAAMQTLDGPTVARVALLLRERIAAGWTHRQIRETLAGNALPDQVRNLGGLVMHRISEIPVGAAPEPDRRVAWSLPAEEPVMLDERPAWMEARERAMQEGRPEAANSALWWALHGVNAGRDATAQAQDEVEA